MATGVAISAGIAMLRSLTGISILPFLIIGYIAAVVLAFYAPPLFTSIAFDAGGVASGVMAATFLLPLSIGVCTAAGRGAGSVMIDAFGTIALVAMTPTITIQIVGISFKSRHKQAEEHEAELDTTVIELMQHGNAPVDDYDVEIIEFSTYKPAQASRGARKARKE